MSEFKFCVDCNYCMARKIYPTQEKPFIWTSYGCSKLIDGEISLVTGKPDVDSSMYRCDWARSKDGLCGPNAIHFIPKKDTP